jgi:hypothetical protein
MFYLSDDSDKYSLDRLFNIGRMPVLSVLLVFAVVVSSCTPSTPVAEADYAKEIVGSWQGTVGGMEESITINADGGFVAQIHAQGFMSNTLSQGSTGIVRGSWALSDAAITLTVTSTEGERLENSTTSSTILSFTTNELEMKSSRGETSKFMR